MTVNTMACSSQEELDLQFVLEVINRLHVRHSVRIGIEELLLQHYEDEQSEHIDFAPIFALLQAITTYRPEFELETD